MKTELQGSTVRPGSLAAQLDSAPSPSSRTIQQQVVVTFRYPVQFTRGLFDPANRTLLDALPLQDRPARLLFVLDDGFVAQHPALQGQIERYVAQHASRLELAGPLLSVPGGEAVKHDPAQVDTVREAINRGGIDRHSYVVVVGGGAVIDMAGYAAATAHRGVRLIRIPTTVLSQNDSAVGVKNSVNRYGKKNWLGTFAPPFAVLNDLDFLVTLPDRDWLGGLSEAVKVALLKDPAFFRELEAGAPALRDRNLDAMDRAVYRCAELHLQHIAGSGDAFEQGSSRPLDFGHWAAHKLEALTHYELRHGEAVAIGIALDSTYSFLAGLLPEADWQRIIRLFQTLGLATFHPRLLDHLDDPAHPAGVLAGLNEFREHLGGVLTIMLLRSVGQPLEVHDMQLDLLRQAILRLQTLSKEETSWPTPTPVH
ncbi:3-dehydroquinate synthase [Deinococcus sonorensis]|uniref:3-dehydroquinate synthase n=2 Tax=Deinococcus sonorensis TaxID=309891 RepID=A0AAU7UGJ6_9DEIO